MTEPVVSIVMPCYQNGATLEQTVCSVQRQTFEGWELIAVNDGSTDDTGERLRALAEHNAYLFIFTNGQKPDAELLKLLSELSDIRREYDKISSALASVKATGYGVVMPTAEEMKLEKPEILKRGGSYGVRLKAGAPSIHMMRVDIDTEISPMVGDEKQSRELIAYLRDEDPEKLWQSNIFGKSVYALIQEGLNAKLIRMPEEVRGKFRGTLSRIVNEGASGLICLIL